MKESRSEYELVWCDDHEEVIKVVFVHRVCGCTSPGCVDDSIEVYEPGEEHPYRVDIPRLMTPYLEGLFDREYLLNNPAPTGHAHD